MEVAGGKCKADDKLRKVEKKNKPISTPRTTRGNPSPVMTTPEEQIINS